MGSQDTNASAKKAAPGPAATQKRERVKEQSHKLPTLARAVQIAATAVRYLKNHSHQPPLDSIDSLAQARSIRRQIKKRLQYLLKLSRQERVGWLLFGAEIDKLSELFKKAHRLCRSIQTKAAQLEDLFEKIAGHLKWVRNTIDKLTTVMLRNREEAAETELAEIDRRFRQIEKFADGIPSACWPDPATIDVALEAIQKLVKHIGSTVSGDFGRRSTLKIYLRGRDFTLIDSALQLLPD